MILVLSRPPGSTVVPKYQIHAGRPFRRRRGRHSPHPGPRAPPHQRDRHRRCSACRRAAHPVAPPHTCSTWRRALHTCEVRLSHGGPFLHGCTCDCSATRAEARQTTTVVCLVMHGDTHMMVLGCCCVSMICVPHHSTASAAKEVCQRAEFPDAGIKAPLPPARRPLPDQSLPQGTALCAPAATTADIKKPQSQLLSQPHLQHIALSVHTSVLDDPLSSTGSGSGLRSIGTAGDQSQSSPSGHPSREQAWDLLLQHQQSSSQRASDDAGGTQAAASVVGGPTYLAPAASARDTAASTVDVRLSMFTKLMD